MANGKRGSSTGGDPFGSYREFTASVSFDEGIADGLGFPSTPLNAFEANPGHFPVEFSESFAAWPISPKNRSDRCLVL
jgi:hypothetical protein